MTIIIDELSLKNSNVWVVGVFLPGVLGLGLEVHSVLSRKGWAGCCEYFRGSGMVRE